MSELLTRQPALKAYGDIFQAVLADLPADENRKSSMDQFMEHGFPHRRVEEWKYTDLASVIRTAGDVVVDYNPELGAGEGVDIDCLEQATLNDDDLPVVLMNRALWTGGTKLNVPAGVSITEPVQIEHNGQEAGKTLVQRHELTIGAGASVLVIERFGEDCAFSNHVTSIVLEKGARLTHIRVQGNETGTHVLTQSVQIDEDAHYKAIVLSEGADLSRCETHVRFVGERASCDVQGVMMAADKQTMDHTFFVDHRVANCSSNVSFRTVLDGDATGVFQAKTIVAEGAQHTDGRQMSKAILLSDTAAMNAKPELEIYADDVACAHGATTGELDEDQVFYLQSRGIPEKEARALLIKAFLSDVFDEVEDETLRETLVSRVDDWLDSRSTAQAGKEEAA